MRNNLKKMIDGAEAAIQICGTILFYISLSPFFLLVWFFAIFRIIYNYSKHPDLTFEECVRYNFTWDTTDHYYGNEPEQFYEPFYSPSRKFDLGEYKRVKNVIEGSL